MNVAASRIIATILALAVVGTTRAGGDQPRLSERLAAEDPATLAAAVEREGDPARGANLFHARQLACTQCHVAGDGESPLGPNLAALPAGVAPDGLVPHLVESVLEPSA
ncbi:MAG: hypothetical protein FJ284_15815, partial [Planctomycetes bacterium]|nr:hypothetical protein [Planctomycetota bacterium]